VSTPTNSSSAPPASKTGRTAHVSIWRNPAISIVWAVLSDFMRVGAELEFCGTGPGVDPNKFQFRPTAF